MSNAPGHSPVFTFEDEPEIQPFCRSSTSYAELDLIDDFAYDPFANFADGEITDTPHTPALSAPSSSSSAAPSLPNDTPPPRTPLNIWGVYGRTESEVEEHTPCDVKSWMEDHRYVSVIEETRRIEAQARDTLAIRQLHRGHPFLGDAFPLSSPGVDLVRLQNTPPPLDRSVPHLKVSRSRRISRRVDPYPITTSGLLLIGCSKPKHCSVSPVTRSLPDRYKLRNASRPPKVEDMSVELSYIPSSSSPSISSTIKSATKDRQSALVRPSEPLTPCMSPSPPEMGRPRRKRQHPLEATKADGDYDPRSPFDHQASKIRTRRRSTKKGLTGSRATGEQPFFCERKGCTEGFTRAHDLMRHENQVHDKQVHPCDSCPAILSRLDSLTRHKVHKHSAKQRWLGMEI
jgi:hypothetical protein